MDRHQNTTECSINQNFALSKWPSLFYSVASRFSARHYPSNLAATQLWHRPDGFMTKLYQQMIVPFCRLPWILHLGGKAYGVYMGTTKTLEIATHQGHIPIISPPHRTRTIVSNYSSLIYPQNGTPFN